MPTDVQQIAGRIEAKTRIILDRYAMAMSQRAQAYAEIERLKKEVESLTAQIQRLQSENEFLKVATTIAPDRKDVASTRAILTDLVRKIDKCIIDLND